MKNKTEKRGGLRPSNPGGRPKKAAKRETVSVCLDPDNLEYRKQVGRGWNDLVNWMVEGYRTGKPFEEWEMFK